jgi:membrane-bound lytic murein transglycosylase D
MPRTGRLYLRITRYVDERRDPIESSRAAARYLQAAYRDLGSWPLAITSYNHGVYGVAQKTRDFGSRDIVAVIEHAGDPVFGFASTNFYPEFLASLEIYNDHERYFPSVKLEAAPLMVKVRVTRPLSVSFVEQQLGVSAEELQRLNYGLSKLVWSGRAPIPTGYNLKVPQKAVDKVANLRLPETEQHVVVAAASSIYGGGSYTVRRGDTLSSIARRYNTTPQKLINLNELESAEVRIGQVLVVRARETPKVDTDLKQRGAAQRKEDKHETAGAAYQVYTVGPGDTLYSLARKFHVSVEELQRVNRLPAARVNLGQKITIPAAEKLAQENKQSAAARTYRVKKGDNLFAISKKTAVPLETLKSLNKLKKDTVQPGQVLRLP